MVMKRRSFISNAGVAAGATVAASTIGAPAIAQGIKSRRLNFLKSWAMRIRIELWLRWKNGFSRSACPSTRGMSLKYGPITQA